jgi:hypothetical protein
MEQNQRTTFASICARLQKTPTPVRRVRDDATATCAARRPGCARPRNPRGTSQKIEEPLGRPIGHRLQGPREPGRVPVAAEGCAEATM